MKKRIDFVIKDIVVISRRGYTDQISFQIDAETPFPEMECEPTVTIQARQGYGAEWCRNVLGIDPEVIKS